MDKVIKERRSKMMAAIKGRGNLTTEVALMKVFRKEKIAGWRRHYDRVEGRPDFAFPKQKVAVFIDGCFWHGCKKHATTPKTNIQFWEEKIVRNKERDKKVNRELRKSGWKVVRIWEHEMKKGQLKILRKLNNNLIA